MRDSFIFYKTFFECVESLPMRSGYALFMAICEYVYNEKEPELSGPARAMFNLMRAQIDANNRKYENGKKGGRPKEDICGFESDEINQNQIELELDENQVQTDRKPKQNQIETKLKPKRNQTKTESKANVNVNSNVNGNANDTENDNADSSCVYSKGTRFNEFYSLYPKKKDMLKTQEEYTLLLETTESLSEESLLAAARNYAGYCQILVKKERYIKNPANWLKDSSWIDYLPENYQEPEVEVIEKPVKQKQSSFQFKSREYQFNDLERQLLGVK